MTRIILAFLFLLPAACLAAPPVLTVTHTEVAVSGDILRIEASAEGAKSYTWQVWTDGGDESPTAEQIEAIRRAAERAGLSVTANENDGEKSYHMSFEGGRVITLPTWEGQEWVVFSSVANETGEQASKVLKIVVPGKKPPKPGPDPKPDPDVPLSTLAAKVAAAVKPFAAAYGEFSEVADVYESVAAMSAAGAFVGPDEVVQKTSELSRVKLKTHLKSWSTVIEAVIGPHLNTMSEAGKLETAQDHVEPWNDIATGIRSGIN